MPRPRLIAGQTVSWKFAGFTFVGKLIEFNHTRRYRDRSAVVRVSPVEYEKHLQAIDAWSNRQKLDDTEEELTAAIEDDDIIWVLSKAITAVDENFVPPKEGVGPDTHEVPVVAGRKIRKFKKSDEQKILDWGYTRSLDLFRDKERFAAWVCEQDETVIGVLLLRSNLGRFGGFGDIMMVHVEEGFRRQGVGRSLIKTASKYVKRNKRLFLACTIQDDDGPELLAFAQATRFNRRNLHMGDDKPSTLFMRSVI